MFNYLLSASDGSDTISNDLYDSVDLMVHVPVLDEILDPDDADDAEILNSTPLTHPVYLANWVGVDINDETIRLSVSLGDPRGCLEMVLRGFVDDDGITRTLLTVPTEEESHVSLRPRGPGQFIVGYGRYPAPPRVTDEEVSSLRTTIGNSIESLDPERDADTIIELMDALATVARLDAEREAGR